MTSSDNAWRRRSSSSLWVIDEERVIHLVRSNTSSAYVSVSAYSSDSGPSSRSPVSSRYRCWHREHNFSYKLPTLDSSGTTTSALKFIALLSTYLYSSGLGLVSTILYFTKIGKYYCLPFDVPNIREANVNSRKVVSDTSNFKDSAW